MTHVTCRLTAKNRDQLRSPTLGNRVWAPFTFFYTPCMGLSLASLVCSGGVLAARRRDADGRLRQCRAVHAAQVGAHHEDHQATIHRCYDVVERLCRRHASMYTSGGDKEHRCCLLVYTPLLLAHVVNSDSVAVFKHRLACVNFS